MPHHKSAAKRVITNERRRRSNIADRSRLRGVLRAVRSATSRAQGAEAYQAAMSLLDRTAAKGVIKKETASRHKARLALFVNRLPA
jgi:small subunit ribosomal protein S20